MTYLEAKARTLIENLYCIRCDGARILGAINGSNSPMVLPPPSPDPELREADPRYSDSDRINRLSERQKQDHSALLDILKVLTPEQARDLKEWIRGRFTPVAQPIA